MPPHPRLLRAAAAAGVLTSALAACGGGTTATGTTTVTVFAAASTAAVMAREIAAFEARHPGVHVDGDYEGTQSLLTKLAADPAAADLLLSADLAHMATATAKGLVAAAQLLAANHLVVAVPAGNPGHVTGLADLSRPGLRLVLADTSVPAGSYAEKTLHTAEARGDVPAGFAAEALANVASRETDVEGVVAKVASGDVDAGIVYATDAVADRRITALPIPTADQPAAVYPVAVTTHAPHAAAARQFLAFLFSADGRRILRDAGFASPPSPTAAP